ncbi:MAG: (d)CMP kinase [Candidatus Arsenophonus melophagi]|nr:(d)CMP kinase [Candidatus Arsenophonus melophagi]
MSLLPPVITVDGPSGVGKGTLCQALASQLGWQLLDSGIIYRTLALVALKHNIDVESKEEVLVSLVTKLNICCELIEKELVIMLEGKDISSEIRSNVVANMASLVATFPRVREALFLQQRTFRTKPGLIADGRDMGTVVFPDAMVKIFLDAKPEERAFRRMKQLQKKGVNIQLSDVLADIKERDYRDCNRKVSPLVIAQDALIVDSTKLTIPEVNKQVFTYIKKILSR